MFKTIWMSNVGSFHRYYVFLNERALIYLNKSIHCIEIVRVISKSATYLVRKYFTNTVYLSIRIWRLVKVPPFCYRDLWCKCTELSLETFFNVYTDDSVSFVLSAIDTGLVFNSRTPARRKPRSSTPVQLSQCDSVRKKKPIGQKDRKNINKSTTPCPCIEAMTATIAITVMINAPEKLVFDNDRTLLGPHMA